MTEEEAAALDGLGGPYLRSTYSPPKNTDYYLASTKTSGANWDADGSRYYAEEVTIMIQSPNARPYNYAELWIQKVS